MRISALILVAVLPTTLWGEIILDGSTGTTGSLSGSMTIGESLGTRNGDTLVHSFAAFHVRTGESATFTGSPDLSRVITRVTGGEVSSINGPIRLTIPNAALFLINANGFMLGDQASLEAPRALVLSTANELMFADGSRLNDDADIAFSVSTAPISGYGFTDSAAPIQVDGSLIRAEEIGLFGGEMALVDATAFAPSGKIVLAATRGGEIDVSSDIPQLLGEGAAINVALRDFDRLRVLDGQLRANIDVSGAPAGAIVVRGQDLELDGAFIFADSSGGQGSRGIDIDLSGALRLSNARITADNLDPLGGSTSGSVNVQAADAVWISGSGSAIATNVFGNGNGGALAISTEHLTVEEGGGIQAITSGSGNAGTIRIEAERSDLRTGGRISATTAGNGRGASIQIVGQTFRARDGSTPERGASGVEVSTLGGGDAGDLLIEVDEFELIDGASAQSFTVDSSSAGRAGEIRVNAQRILVDSALIDVRTFGRDGGGTVNLSAAQSITIAGEALLSGQTFIAGEGGDVQIIAPEVLLLGGTISTTTSGEGEGGGVMVTAAIRVELGDFDIASTTNSVGDAGSIVIETSDFIAARGSLRSESTGRTATAGDAGRIELRTDSFFLRDGATISTDATEARGGDIIIFANDQMFVRSAAVQASAGAAGMGGNIDIQADLVLLDEAQILARADAGNGGKIDLAANAVVANIGSVISADSNTGTSGTVVIDAPNDDISNAIQPQAAALLAPPVLIADPCLQPRGNQNRLVIEREPFGGFPELPVATGRPSTSEHGCGPAGEITANPSDFTPH